MTSVADHGDTTTAVRAHWTCLCGASHEVEVTPPCACGVTREEAANGHAYRAARGMRAKALHDVAEYLEDQSVPAHICAEVRRRAE